MRRTSICCGTNILRERYSVVSACGIQHVLSSCYMYYELLYFYGGMRKATHYLLNRCRLLTMITIENRLFNSEYLYVNTSCIRQLLVIKNLHVVYAMRCILCTYLRTTCVGCRVVGRTILRLSFLPPHKKKRSQSKKT